MMTNLQLANRLAAMIEDIDKLPKSKEKTRLMRSAMDMYQSCALGATEPRGSKDRKHEVVRPMGSDPGEVDAYAE